MSINRDVFFEQVKPIFGGKLSQEQVDGMSAILDVAESRYADWDMRWIAYPLATTKWETSSTMQPIEEYGKGKGMKYGSPDPETGETYYGRGYVQLTWRDNYAKVDKEFAFDGDESCEWHADNALDPDVAAAVMFVGMEEGWFRSADGTPNNLEKYFNDTRNDAYTAREIINGDKSKVPDWTGGVSIGNYIKNDHEDFLAALNKAFVADIGPEPDEMQVVTITVDAPPGVRVEVKILAPES